MPPQSIDEVLAELDHIIAEAAEQGRRLGYFAALYRDVTARVDAAIEAGEFQDNARMARLDVAFAHRYLDALKTRGTKRARPARRVQRPGPADEPHDVENAAPDRLLGGCLRANPPSYFLKHIVSAWK